MTNGSNGAGPLRTILEEAAQTTGGTMNDFTVLAQHLDPYRVDTPAGHRDAAWFAEQVARFVGTYGIIHLVGLRYQIFCGGRRDSTE